MKDPSKIPYLIKLLDDDNPDIRTRIMLELSSYGFVLKDELKRLALSLTTLQKECLGQIFADQKRNWLRHSWPAWFNIKCDSEKLEAALTILAQFLTKSENHIYLSHLLDKLADGYRDRFDVNEPKLLSHYLFREVGFKGNEDDYSNPQNSNLIFVIKEKKGIPISLACVYMLVGERLGLDIEGCNFPGHFLARIDFEGRKVLVDCFNGGKMIEERDIIQVHLQAFQGIQNIVHERAEVEAIVRRFLANLIRAYQGESEAANNQLIIDLFKALDYRAGEERIGELTPDDIIANKTAHFKPGQMVLHQRYGYRGLIVDHDGRCKASDNWYYANQTQPGRDQPWYHVLVSGSDQVTYVAESSLDEDPSREKINHPLLSHFFTRTKDGQYVRNENPWPETDF